jgi:hypothetical protein
MLICGDVEEAAICPKPRRSDILVIARCVTRNDVTMIEVAEIEWNCMLEVKISSGPAFKS